MLFIEAYVSAWTLAILTIGQVVSVDIDCVPLENCPFALNLLAKRHISAPQFLRSSKCGRDEITGKIKVWCSTFVNCRTADSRQGTCLPATDCSEINQITKDAAQNPTDFLNDYQCHVPGKTEVYVCCPWATPGQSSILRPKRVPMFQRYHPDDEPIYFNNHNHLHHHHHDHSDFGHNHDDPISTTTTTFQDAFEASHRHWTSESSFRDSLWPNVIDNPTNEEKCLTPENIKGVCKDVFQCPTMLRFLNKNKVDNLAIKYLKRFKCPGKNRVCCTGVSVILPTTTSPRTETTTPTEVQCGRQSLSNKIVGGTLTDLGEFPWAALLEYNSRRGRQFGCGGSVISTRFILTAAHCVNEGILRQNGFEQVDKVILGEYDTRNQTDCFYTSFGTDCANPVQYFAVERIIEHERFSDGFSATSARHDIGLIKVDRDILYSDYIQPVCLPDKSFRLNGNENFFITGWGRTETGLTSPIKLKARLALIDKDNCSRTSVSLGDGQICLASGQGVDSCKGDSGGAVMQIKAIAGDIITTAVGIISYGFGNCGTSNSVSTYVPFYLDWIKENVNQN